VSSDDSQPVSKADAPSPATIDRPARIMLWPLRESSTWIRVLTTSIGVAACGPVNARHLLTHEQLFYLHHELL